MFWIIVIGLVVAILVWVYYRETVMGKAQLKNVEACISQIESNPNSPSAYDKFIDVWKSSPLVPSGDLFNEGHYDRILKICEKNSSNVKAWQALGEVVKRLNRIFGIDLSGQRNRAKTFRLLTDSIFKEFENQPVKEWILLLIHMISGISQAETQELYNTSLKVLETNSSTQEAKILVLDLGRLHYSNLRPDKKPTIYDEQAIQNDIIVRSK